MLDKMLLLNTMPPSAQIVYQVLQVCESLNSEDLKSETRYSIRTIRYALQHLLKASLIVQIPDITDTRRCYYTITS